MVFVRVAGDEGCDDCLVREVCRAKDGILEVPTKPGAELAKGTPVRVRIERIGHFPMGALVYGLPLAGVLVSIGIGAFVGSAVGSEAVTALTSFGLAALTIVLAVFGLRRLDRKVAAKIRYRLTPLSPAGVEEGENAGFAPEDLPDGTPTRV